MLLGLEQRPTSGSGPRPRGWLCLELVFRDNDFHRLFNIKQDDDFRRRLNAPENLIFRMEGVVSMIGYLKELLQTLESYNIFGLALSLHLECREGEHHLRLSCSWKRQHRPGRYFGGHSTVTSLQSIDERRKLTTCEKNALRLMAWKVSRFAQFPHKRPGRGNSLYKKWKGDRTWRYPSKGTQDDVPPSTRATARPIQHLIGGGFSFPLESGKGTYSQDGSILKLGDVHRMLSWRLWISFIELKRPAIDVDE